MASTDNWLSKENEIMKKKQYISPVSEITDLRVMNAMMDGPLFGPASMPTDQFKDNVPQRRRTPVF